MKVILLAQLGHFGDEFVFITHDEYILTFSNFQQTVSAKWASHDRIGKKPVCEFLGSELRKISMDVILDIMLGVKPKKQLKVIERLVETGFVCKLVINQRPVGKHKWKIVKMSEAWNCILKKGELAQATVSLEFEEYL